LSNIPFTIDYEINGVTIFRPFIVLHPIGKWETDNIAFFLSTGTSNIKNGFSFKNTWLPTPGLVDNSIEIKDRKNDVSQVFHIIKLSQFLPPKTDLITSLYDLYVNYLLFLYNNKKDEWINAGLSAIINNITDIENAFSIYFTKNMCAFLNSYGCRNIVDLLQNYITDVWQIYLSCFIGGNFWNDNTLFTSFIENKITNEKIFFNDTKTKINYTINTINNLLLEPSIEQKHFSTKHETIDFLKTNNCNFNQENIDTYKKWVYDNEYIFLKKEADDDFAINKDKKVRRFDGKNTFLSDYIGRSKPRFKVIYKCPIET
jgi:hypothetical protein